MSVSYKGGLDHVRSYSGALKFIEGALHIGLIICTIPLEGSFQAQFLCGVCIYGFISVVVLMAFHIRGLTQSAEFPWFWVECFNCAVMTLLLLVASSLVTAVLTKGYIITGIIGFIAVLVYVLDTIENFQIAVTPRARYVWTTPNMPE